MAATARRIVGPGGAVRLGRWTGGYNSNAGPYDLAPNESPDITNMVPTPRGGWRKRDGYLDLTNAADLVEQPKSLGRVTGVGGTTTKLIAGTDTKLVALQPATAGVSLFTGTNAFWEFVQAPASGGQGPLYAMNGVDTPQQWDGAAATTTNWTASAGAVPNGRYAKVKQNRLWVAGVTADPSALFFSELGDPRNWPASNVVRFDPGDGESIMGLGTIGPYLIVFKPNKAWIVYDLDRGLNRPLGENVGTRSHRSVVETEQGAFFLDPDKGVMVTNGQSVKPISRNITPDLRAVKQEFLSRAAGAFWRGHYYLSVPDLTGVPATVFDFSTELDSWWRHDAACWQFVVSDFPGNADTVLRDESLFGALATQKRWAQIFRPGQLGDQIGGAAITPISFHGKTAPLDLDGSVSTRKQVQELRVDGRGQCDVYDYPDFAPAGVLLGTLALTPLDTTLWEANDGQWEVEDGGFWEGSSSLGQASLYTLGVARTWGFEVRGVTAASEFELEALTAILGTPVGN